MKIGNLEVYGIIYKVENLINGKIYIGQTTQGYDRRYCKKGSGAERIYERHKMLRDFGYEYNKHLLDAFDKYGVDNFSVNKELDYAFSEYELNIKEKCWIQYYNSYKNGYNRTMGGEGTSGYDGLKRENNPASRSVVQLSMIGEYINKWKCMKDASEHVNVSVSKICSVCRGERHSAKGYIWVYEEEYDLNKDYCYTGKHVSKPLVMLDKNYNLIKEYNSIKELTDENNYFKKGGISKCCNRDQKTYKGFIFLYKYDYLKLLKHESPTTTERVNSIYDGDATV